MLLAGGVLTWTNVRGEPVASMGCELDLQDPETPLVILRCMLARTGEAVASVVRLDATRPHFGGLRRWFACPLCGRRVGKLYLPPGETYVACRVCFGLTYRSCQESHTVDVLPRVREALRKMLAEPYCIPREGVRSAAFLSITQDIQRLGQVSATQREEELRRMIEGGEAFARLQTENGRELLQATPMR